MHIAVVTPTHFDVVVLLVFEIGVHQKLVIEIIQPLYVRHGSIGLHRRVRDE
jgi:hypothetical protein